MKRLIARVGCIYNGRPLRFGEEFTATVSHARVLVALGRARYATTAALVRPLIVETAAPEPVKPPRRRRTYQRRDMRAED